MTTARSLDLRVRVVAAVAFGLSHRAAGERFGVSAASVSRWRARAREQGDPSPKPMGGDQRSRHIEAQGALILRLYEATRSCAKRLRKAAERTGGALWDRIGVALDAFTPSECANSFAAAGYDAA